MHWLSSHEDFFWLNTETQGLQASSNEITFAFGLIGPKIFGVSGGGAPKANKVRELLDTGKYDYVYFVDDSLNNLNAVREDVAENNIEIQYKLAS